MTTPKTKIKIRYAGEQKRPQSVTLSPIKTDILPIRES